MRSLVIEDEPQIGAYLGRLLGQLRGIVDIVGSLSDAKQALGNFKYDLAIVDRMLPDGDALDIVMALSQLPERPAVIMLTAKDAKEDMIDGLNSGADDYLGKPFEPQEFIARVRAVLLRPRLLVTAILSFPHVDLPVRASALPPDRDGTYCHPATAILNPATVVDPGHGLIIRSTGLTDLRSHSPRLWYAVSYDNLMSEFGQDRRPALPSLPYAGPIGLSVLNTLDQKSSFCMAVVKRDTSKLVMMIGGAQVQFGQVAEAFLLRNH